MTRGARRGKRIIVTTVDMPLFDMDECMADLHGSIDGQCCGHPGMCDSEGWEPPPETFDGPRRVDEGRQGAGEEIRGEALGDRLADTGETRMPEQVADRQPAGVVRVPSRPLLPLPSRRGGKFTMLVMVAARYAREGYVVDLHDRDGMVALTWEDDAYRLTDEALLPTPWKQRVRSVLDRLDE